MKKSGKTLLFSDSEKEALRIMTDNLNAIVEKIPADVVSLGTTSFTRYCIGASDECTTFDVIMASLMCVLHISHEAFKVLDNESEDQMIEHVTLVKDAMELCFPEVFQTANALKFLESALCAPMMEEEEPNLN